jgi:hypothetical protein
MKPLLPLVKLVPVVEAVLYETGIVTLIQR